VIHAIEWAATVGDDINEAESYPLNAQGSISTLNVEAQQGNAVERLHEALREAGVKIDSPAPRRIGFLP
jgi:hypothetical protein